MELATSWLAEARFVRARRDSKVGRRSRGPVVSVRTGVLEDGGLRRDERGGTAEDIWGIVPEGKRWCGFREIRIRARA